MRRFVLLAIFGAACAAAAAIMLTVLWRPGPHPLPPPETYRERFLREVRAAILEEERLTPYIDGGPPPAFSAFFRARRALPLALDAEEFGKIKSGAFVLDAREDEEWALGRYPGSIHIRYADVRAGRWRELPADRVVYVLCHSGVRGEVVARFLRSRGVLAQTVSAGAAGWVAAGGAWEGTIDFYGRYADARYTRWLTRAQIKQVLAQPGITAVDARPPYRQARWPFPGAVSLPLALTPTPELERRIAMLPAAASVLVLCEDYSTCFDATTLGIRLEGRGMTFLGLGSLAPEPPYSGFVAVP